MTPRSPKPSILAKPDGPYLVRDLATLSNRKGPLETKPTVALCRCGGSKNKPFCDGTHARIGFSSAKVEGRVADERKSYAAESITIQDNRGICAHAGVCTERLAAVFRLKQEPWIDPHGAKRNAIIDAVRGCPSGALSYSVDGAEAADPEREPAIFVAENGPYVVTGGPDFADAAFGQGASKEHFTLCRCGASKNKPFCDGSHFEVGFTDDRN